MSWMAPDYEPTADEIQEFLRADWLKEAPDGTHGDLHIIPTMERYIWAIPVFWGNRRVDDDGNVVFTWVIPPPCERCGKL